jgi:pimeloyl-ACP methyl ester carboxylesterase
MTTPPIILVPGFWLGAWAWDEVATELRAAGHEVTALTLPGLESADEDRSKITAQDHVNAICSAIEAAGRPVVLAVHSGTGYSGYAASDRRPEDIAAMIYVDTGAGVGAMDEEFQGAEKPMLTPKELAADENIDGLSADHLARFQERALPEPGGVLREAIPLTNDARLDIPSTVIATAYPSSEYRKGMEEGWGFVAGLRDLRDLTWVDLPTSHWPMWSKPRALADIIGDIAKQHSTAGERPTAPAGARA